MPQLTYFLLSPFEIPEKSCKTLIKKKRMIKLYNDNVFYDSVKKNHLKLLGRNNRFC